ncbi:hypothetical protein GOV07_00030 [Candidatus Woesearchaeota archaeon]|nr:hypothetical protein [Candidatus Woesearchaeota archaeon]
MSDDPRSSEQNVYSDAAREKLMEDGEISAEEQAFMEGYDQAEKEEEESNDEAYEAAFAKRAKKRRSRATDDFDEEEEYEPE